MKKTLTRLFWPILKFFEAGESKGHYKKSHRAALNGVGGLFLLLALISAVAANAADQVGALIPVLIFFSAGGGRACRWLARLRQSSSAHLGIKGSEYLIT